jgi:hypothetical protein
LIALSEKAAPVTMSVPWPSLRMMLLAVSSSAPEIGRVHAASGQLQVDEVSTRPRTAAWATRAPGGGEFSPKPR